MYTYLLISSVFFLQLTPSRWPKIVVKVDCEQVSSKTGKILFFRQLVCLLNYHNDSSTIPVVFVVKFWSTITEMISSGTMKEELYIITDIYIYIYNYNTIPVTFVVKLRSTNMEMISSGNMKEESLTI